MSKGVTGGNTGKGMCRLRKMNEIMRSVDSALWQGKRCEVCVRQGSRRAVEVEGQAVKGKPSSAKSPVRDTARESMRKGGGINESRMVATHSEKGVESEKT